MARANIPLRQVSVNGPLDLQALETQLDAVDGGKFLNNGRVRLYVRNAGAGAHVLTFITPGTVGGNPIQDKTITVGAGKEALLPYFDRAIYNQPSGADQGYVYFSADGTQTEVRVVALQE